MQRSTLVLHYNKGHGPLMRDCRDCSKQNQWKIDTCCLLSSVRPFMLFPCCSHFSFDLTKIWPSECPDRVRYWIKYLNIKLYSYLVEYRLDLNTKYKGEMHHYDFHHVNYQDRTKSIPQRENEGVRPGFWLGNLQRFSFSQMDSRDASYEPGHLLWTGAFYYGKERQENKYFILFWIPIYWS